VSILTNHCNRPTSPDEQHLYNHLLAVSQIELPEQMVERFRWLFLEGIGYPDSAVQEALERIVLSDNAGQDFRFILNRCCHILINRWQLYPRFQVAIADLISLFSQPPSTAPASRATRRLRELLRHFSQTEQYLSLQRWVNVLQQNAEAFEKTKPLGSYIRRYPYLFEHCLLVEDSGDEQWRMIRQMQATAQRQLELDLSQYITHRLLRTAPVRALEPQTTGVGSSGRSAFLTGSLSSQRHRSQETQNPTLLEDPQLEMAIRQFGGKSDGQNTQRDLAQQFLTYTSQAPTYRVFKHDLYEYLRGAIAPSYGNCQFYDRLYDHLLDTFPENDGQAANDFLRMRTYIKLLNFLVVESPQQPNHGVFLDLMTNIGTTLTINLMLKIVLLCQKAKPHLERRFSILFNHYEHYTRDTGIVWLIEALENLNVAFAINFGSVSCVGV